MDRSCIIWARYLSIWNDAIHQVSVDKQMTQNLNSHGGLSEDNTAVCDSKVNKHFAFWKFTTYSLLSKYYPQCVKHYS